MNLSKKISLILAAATVASAMTACAVPQNTNASITASAGAEKYADLLSERLGDSMPEDVVIAMGEDAEKYGVDLSDFVDDEGYTIRANDGEVVILGKSEASLDRAVRQYANYGNAEDYSYTYGEDYRVGGISIAGNDISEYSVMLPEESDECHTYATENLREYIGKACGVYPEIIEYSADAEGRFIRFERVYPEDGRYATLGDEGFTIKVDDAGDMTISGGYLRGCMYGVFDLLEEYIGWRFLYDFGGYSNTSVGAIDYLYEAERIDIPAGTEYTEVPSFELRRNIFRNSAIGDENFRMKRKTNSGIPAELLSKYNMYNIQGIANHGITKSEVYKQFPGFDKSLGVQPCFTDEEVIGISKEFFVAQTQAKIDAGQKIGYDFTHVDVGHMDVGKFCPCQSCLEYVALDGGNVGPVLYYTNEIAGAIADEFGEELKVAMFAYWGTTSVPRTTVPDKNVLVSYCFYTDTEKAVCYSHPLDGTGCTEGEISNVKYAEELRGWCEIAETVNVWYYPGYWWDPAMTAPLSRHLQRDIAFMYECGVDGLFICVDGYTMQDDKIMPYLMSHLAWDATVTEEEYEALIREYYMIMAGDGYEYLYEYHNRIEDYARDGCWSAMGMQNPGDRIDLERVKNGFLYDIELFGRAIALAGSAAQEEFIRELSMSMYFTGLVSSHSEWYLNGDAESKALYEELYNGFVAEAVEMGYKYDKNKGIADKTDTLDVSVNLAKLYGEKDKWWIPYKYQNAE